MMAGANPGSTRWIFDDPIVRKIKLELRDGARNRRRAVLAKIVVGTGAATFTFFAGVEVLDLGAILWRVTDLYLFAPLASALTPP